MGEIIKVAERWQSGLWMGTGESGAGADSVGGGQECTEYERNPSCKASLGHYYHCIRLVTVGTSLQDQQGLLHPALWHKLIRRNSAYVGIMPHICTIAIT